MRLLWQPQALEDLRSVQRYISLESPAVAKRIVIMIATTTHDQLTMFPESGRIGRVEGTRELVIPKTPFIVPYRINGDVIDILAVHHTSQRWPTAF